MLIVVDHPLVKVHISILRRQETGTDAFRQHLTALTRLLAFPALQDLQLTPISVRTPLAETTGYRVQKMLVLVPVLRAGLGMVEGFRDVVPDTVVSHLGMYRDHRTLKPIRYYSNFPASYHDHPVILLDPMLATGGSAVDALDYLKAEGARNIRVVSIISAPEGVKKLEECHPDVRVYTAQLDERLNELGYIIPGLGDAGDRQFGTVPD
ncbi:MAG: uracil phosphoribosyltransferase [Sulfobacillus thermotolerans]|uniref:Uracil phosphoribosyltransferase n=1 Tax=Sulfobacillus thermotolerans TaxID=338644 RepID=A0ABM6RTG8_9FIRM|nr:uracil phosphoribosyltransferase [Sulfobacillus thermotolerans]MCY0908013.1 uracil phosphoribosyltransferase [Sulfobacillus thermotolerans]